MQKTIFHIGEKPVETLDQQHYVNPIRQALWYKQLLDEGKFERQEDLAKELGVSRSRVTSVLRLLSLDEGIQEFILGLGDEDELLEQLTERKLRSLIQLDKTEQQDQFWKMTDREKPITSPVVR